MKKDKNGRDVYTENDPEYVAALKELGPSIVELALLRLQHKKAENDIRFKIMRLAMDAYIALGNKEFMILHNEMKAEIRYNGETVNY